MTEHLDDVTTIDRKGLCGGDEQAMAAHIPERGMRKDLGECAEGHVERPWPDVVHRHPLRDHAAGPKPALDRLIIFAGVEVADAGNPR